MERAEELLEFWFGPLGPTGLPTEAVAARWFRSDPAFDAALRRRFGADHEAARAGALDGWAATPRGRLALVILLDQLARNLYRGTPDAYAADARALAHARAALDAGEDARLRPIERIFLYLPFEHAEDLAAQEVAVARFRALAAGAPRAARGLFAEYAHWAERHRDVIARFGRFPHRNAILGRASTPEEEAFLATPGSSFG